MSEEPISAQRISPIQPEGVKVSGAAAAQKLSQYAILQEASQEGFTEWAELDAFNPLAMARRFETLDNKVRRKKEEETEKTEKKDEQIVKIEKLDEVSEQYERKNPELKAQDLLVLRKRIKEDDTKEEILSKVLESYTDYALADEALDFLLDTTRGDLHERVKQAKDDLAAQYGREVRAGRNIQTDAQEYAKKGLGSATALRNLYRDITGNPRDAITLFFQLTTHFNFSKMKDIIDFLLHALGTDLKAKGPSISSAELHRLMTEGKSMQAILQIYRFFRSRMKLIMSAFARQGMVLPRKLTFELLAKEFVIFLQERYPSGEKLRSRAKEMAIGNEIPAQIVIYMQMRDGVRQVAPKLFRSEQHRQEVLAAYIDALEDLEEEMEEDEEKEEKKDE